MLPSESAHYETRLDALRTQLADQEEALRIDDSTARRVFELASTTYKDHPTVAMLSSQGPLRMHRLATLIYGMEYERMSLQCERSNANLVETGRFLLEAQARERAAEVRVAMERRAQQDMLDRLHTSLCSALPPGPHREVALDYMEKVRLILHPNTHP